MAIRIDQPGPHTSVQDLGRPGLRHLGVPLGGAVDRVALRVANLLVGSDEGAAALEFAMTGPVLCFDDDCVISVCGARVAGFDSWKAHRVRGGTCIQLGPVSDGVYGYVAVAGGIDRPLTLGSRSASAWLQRESSTSWLVSRGERFKCGHVNSAGNVTVGSAAFHRWYDSGSPIRFTRSVDETVPGVDLQSTTYTVSSQSNRMGVRLQCGRGCAAQATDRPSRPVSPGAIQLPPDGQPIVLLCDAQTIGGYPVVGHVISADLHRVAQARPGAVLRFTEVSVEAAHDQLQQLERDIALLRAAVSQGGK